MFCTLENLVSVKAVNDLVPAKWSSYRLGYPVRAGKVRNGGMLCHSRTSAPGVFKDSLRRCFHKSKSRIHNAEIPLSEELALKNLMRDVSHCVSYADKVHPLRSVYYYDPIPQNNLLKTDQKCAGFIARNKKWFRSVENALKESEIFALLCVLALGQEHVLLDQDHPHAGNNNGLYASIEACQLLAEDLLKMEKFYDSLGGLIGYQLKSLELILEDKGANENMEYLLPRFLDLSTGDETVMETVQAGVRALPFLAEVYALGGSGDRLGLQCPDSGDLLPSAMLPYCGRSMVDLLIRDLQAREYLYFKLTGTKCTTPIVVMTSDAKDNDARIREMLESSDWYGRGRDSFFLFKQPLVPLIDIETGLWLSGAPGEVGRVHIMGDRGQGDHFVVMRPGGHGVIWKLMFDEGVFDWLRSKRRKAAVLRQVSNPMASTDTTIFALTGLGFAQNKAMGFASCERAVFASEGMNVLQHRPVLSAGRQVHEYGISNIEYTEFERLGLTDVAVGHDSSTSCFPANTNVLYVSLESAEEAVRESVKQGGLGACLPGLIFNKRKMVSYEKEGTGEVIRATAGRMECMMQNLADSLTDIFDSPQNPEEISIAKLSTFMVSNVRRKVTSSAKKKYKPNGPLGQTPEGSFRDLMLNARDLLGSCGVQLPEEHSVEEYLNKGPSFIFLFNPALGPLWSVIQQKIIKGKLEKGSEVVLELAEARIENLQVDGSFLIISDSPIGRKNHVFESSESQGVLEYSNRVGRTWIENVRVHNKGIIWDHGDNVYWKHQVVRHEACFVFLSGMAEFVARNVSIKGSRSFNVPDGYRLELFPDANSEFREELKPIEHQSWSWEYKWVGSEISLSYS